MCKDGGCIKNHLKYNVAWFCFVYLAQGFVNAFDAVAPLYLSRKEFGLSLFQISVAATLSLVPSFLKVPYGIISDKYNFFGFGYRIPYCIIGFIACALSFFFLAFVNPGKMLWLYILLTAFVTASWNLFDGTMDGFIAETVPIEKAGYVQGAVNASRGLGMLLGGAIFLNISGSTGSWTPVFFINTGALLSCLFWIPGVKSADTHERFPFSWDAFKLFKTRRVKFLVAFAMFGTIPIGIAGFLFPLLLTDTEDGFGLSDSEASVFIALAAFGLLLGAATFGILIDKFRDHFLFVFIGMAFCATVTYVFLITATLSSTPSLMYHTGLMSGFAAGGSLASILVVCMVMCDPAISSSFFAINATIWNISFAIGRLLGGALQTSIGYRNAFITAMVMTLCAIPMIPGIFYVKFEEEETDKIYDDMNMPSFQMDAQNYDPNKLQESGEPLVGGDQENNPESSREGSLSKDLRDKEEAARLKQQSGHDEATGEKGIDEGIDEGDKFPDGPPSPLTVPMSPSLEQHNSISTQKRMSSLSSIGFSSRKRSSSRFSMTRFSTKSVNKKQSSFSIGPSAHIIGTTGDGKPVRQSILLTSLARTHALTSDVRDELAHERQRHSSRASRGRTSSHSEYSQYSQNSKPPDVESPKVAQPSAELGHSDDPSSDENSDKVAAMNFTMPKRIGSPSNAKPPLIDVPSTVQEESRSDAHVQDQDDRPAAAPAPEDV